MRGTRRHHCEWSISKAVLPTIPTDQSSTRPEASGSPADCRELRVEVLSNAGRAAVHVRGRSGFFCEALSGPFSALPLPGNPRRFSGSLERRRAERRWQQQFLPFHAGMHTVQTFLLRIAYVLQAIESRRRMIRKLVAEDAH